jgi:2-(3-amino-3-carboxypropyl)histidine synthase
MKIKYLNANYGIDFKLPKDFIKTIEEKIGKNKSLAIYTSIQFVEKLDEIKSQLEKQGHKVITSKPYRASYKGQILGCDSYSDSLNLDLKKVDGFIYIGDGYFHPNALLLSQEYENEIKPVIIANVIQDTIDVIDKTHIDKYLKKKKGNLLKFHTSKVIGVFVSSKWGQEYKDSALKLQNQYKDKEFYFFVSDLFSDNEMENFPFIECWVNTACPRIGQDDIVRHIKPVVNIKDIFLLEFK